MDKEIEKIREEGDKSKGAGKNKRRICKRLDEAIKKRRNARPGRTANLCRPENLKINVVVKNYCHQ